MHPDLNQPTDFIAISFRTIGVRVVEARNADDAIKRVAHLEPVSYTRLTLDELNRFHTHGDLPTR
jgi:hypothetical protein